MNWFGKMYIIYCVENVQNELHILHKHFYENVFLYHR